jgi:hypothetical protein
LSDTRGSELARWEDSLRELGETEGEVAGTLPILLSIAAQSVPLPARGETEVLLTNLQKAFDSTTNQAVRAPGTISILASELTTVLSVARAQLMVFPAAFWFASGIVMLGGVFLVGMGLDPSRILAFYLVGPLLAYLGMRSAFQGTSFGVLELELACPTNPRQLTVARLVVMLGYQVLTGVLLSAPLWLSGSQAILSLTSTWLAPLLLASGLTLVVSLRVSMPRAATLVYAAWTVIVLAAWRLRGPDISVGIPLDAAVAAGGLIFTAATIALLSPNAIKFPHPGERVADSTLRTF